MKVVIDTNVLLVSIPRRSRFRPIFDAVLDGKIEVAITNEILSEYREIIGEKTTDVIANNLAELLMNLPNVELATAYFRWNLIHADKDDNKFVDCAITACADMLISNDRHFRELKKIDYPKVEVLTADEFLDILTLQA